MKNNINTSCLNGLSNKINELNEQLKSLHYNDILYNEVIRNCKRLEKLLLIISGSTLVIGFLLLSANISPYLGITSLLLTGLAVSGATATRGYIGKVKKDLSDNNNNIMNINKKIELTKVRKNDLEKEIKTDCLVQNEEQVIAPIKNYDNTKENGGYTRKRKTNDNL